MLDKRFIGDAADIAALLAASDPARHDRDAQGRLGQIRDQITERAEVGAGSAWRTRLAVRGWWPARPARTRRRAITVCALIPALLAATGAAWVATVSGGGTPSGLIGCYSAPSLHPPGIVGGVVGRGARSPVAYCAHEWAIGVVQGDPGDPGRHPVPPLVECANHGLIGVFPNTTCAALGLRPVNDSYMRAALRVAALSSYLSRRLNQVTCVAEPRAIAVVESALARFKLKGWRVRGYRPDPAAECATVGMGPGRLVFLIGLPGPDSPGATYRMPARFLAHCAQGSQPVSAAPILRGIRAALRAEGYLTWTVVVFGPATSRDQPCYDLGSWNAARRQLGIMSYSRRR